MSPERILGNNYSFASDIWSVGLSLIQCATGKLPYKPSKVYFDFLQLVVNGDPPTLGDGFSSDFQDFVARCLVKGGSMKPV
jgi:serine/threonine protein kinase